MRKRLVSMLGGLCSSLLVVGGIATLVPLHGEYPDAAPLLYLASDHGITAIDAVDGTEAFTATNSIASGDWQQLVSATPSSSSTTRLRTVDAYDGDLHNDTDLDGALDVRAVSFHGDFVALSPDARAVHGEQPGRASTTIVVASTIGAPNRTYDVAANIEPEAFSTDGRALFVIQYLPPMEPDRYQVRRMDLETGELTLVKSVDGANQGQMPGIARTSVMAPDGKRLYTLYTSEENGQRYSFVHVLDLDQQWAHCVDLPRSFGSDPEAMGIAIDPKGIRVHVADVASGRLASIDTQKVAIDHVSRLPLRGVHARPAVAASASQVYVAAQRNLVALSAYTHINMFHSTLASSVRGLHTVSGYGAPELVYVAERHAIVGIDGANGMQLSQLSVTTPRLTGLGFQVPPVTPSTYPCAC